MYKPYKKNILIKPAEKMKIIGDTSTKYLYGEVLDIGTDVKDIVIGDEIAFTQWGTNKVVMEDGTEHFFIADDDQFILGVKKNEVQG